jgi:large subunit ribosomal protein L18
MEPVQKRRRRQRRHKRVRKRIEGSPSRPRLVVYRSNAHIEAQVVDDRAGHTMAAASTRDAAAALPSGEGKVEASRAVGGLLAQRARDAGVEQVVFDRGGTDYPGRVAALAEGARDGGLHF